jgi:Zn finger protein HypA/HybF involved in hydrogenase expression
MRAPTTSELLGVWERGLGQGPPQRALGLLEAAYPETSPETLACLSIGQRDARLLGLRERIFGPEMAAIVACPQCGERLELTVNVAEIRRDRPADPVSEVSLSVEGYSLRLRPPNSLDAADAATQADIELARRLLLDRCVLEASAEGTPVSPRDLPGKVVEAAAECIAKAEPDAELEFSVDCPFCGNHWQAAFDIVSFLWKEVEAWAYRILREVHTLASVYGWHERDILALSPARRQFYLEMVGQ